MAAGLDARPNAAAHSFSEHAPAKGHDPRAAPMGGSAWSVTFDRNAGARAGGGERNRTDDLLLAKQALSQLSYTPKAEDR